jgi:hypothetical protein
LRRIAMTWTDNGPVSLPPRTVVSGVAAVLAVAAIAGIGFGFRGGWRDSGRPGFGGADQTQGADSAIIAKPIVDIPAVEQQPPAANAAANSAAANADESDSNAIAAKTAAVQALQSKQVTTTPDIDSILTPSTEKPQAPAKPSTDEGAPGSPNDVPF